MQGPQAPVWRSSGAGWYCASARVSPRLLSVPSLPFRLGCKCSRSLRVFFRNLNEARAQDVQIDETGVWAHPLWGSVLYVSTTGGGPTLIVEQTKDGRRPWHARPDQVNGTLITPQQGAFARWRGDRLHAVLPPSPPTQCGEAGEEQCEAREEFTERITLTAPFGRAESV